MKKQLNFDVYKYNLCSISRKRANLKLKGRPLGDNSPHYSGREEILEILNESAEYIDLLRFNNIDSSKATKELAKKIKLLINNMRGES